MLLEDNIVISSHDEEERHREIENYMRWRKVPVLDDGFICLVDVMGRDSDVCQAAKVSYGRDWQFNETALSEKLKKVEPAGPRPELVGLGHLYSRYSIEQIERAKQDLLADERGLIRYLMSHHHGTPFEMCEVKFKVRMPMDCHRQMIRHRTANVNEYSTRYAPAIDSAQTTQPDQWRQQALANKQGSSGTVTEWPAGYFLWPLAEDCCDMLIGYENFDPKLTADYNENHTKWGVFYRKPGETDEDCDPDLKAVFEGMHKAEITPGKYLSMLETELQRRSRDVYEERINHFNVAREQARKDLPLSTYTEYYWKCDLRNIFHFLGLRMDAHAQLEIREYANAMAKIVAPLFPVCWEAFQDFQLNAMMLSGPEIAILAKTLASLAPVAAGALGLETAVQWPAARSRERDEAIAKFRRLGLQYDAG